LTIRRTGYAPAEKSMTEIRSTAVRLGIEVQDRTVANREELQALLADLRREKVDGILVLPDTLVISNLDLVLDASLEQRIPTFGLQDFMADWGALGAYGPSAFQAGARVARYIDKIAKGAKPGDLPVEPIDPIMVVNLKTAACLGISIPGEVLHQADRVIE
jgi:putative ABC transport system substrate-binding protein